jgi:hypothetical protein
MLQQENVTTVSMKAASEVTALTISAVVAVLLPTPGVAQGGGRTMAMPDDCQQNAGHCSLEVWTRNSFPHQGSQQSVTFSNGETLACTSNGPNVPRSCTLTGSNDVGNGERCKVQSDAQTAIFAFQQDVDVHRSKTQDKSFQACDEYIRP